MTKEKFSQVPGTNWAQAKSGNVGACDSRKERTLAALDLFAKGDLASVTIKDIAKAVDVNTALKYSHHNLIAETFN